MVKKAKPNRSHLGKGQFEIFSVKIIRDCKHQHAFSNMIRKTRLFSFSLSILMHHFRGRCFPSFNAPFPSCFPSFNAPFPSCFPSFNAPFPSCFPSFNAPFPRTLFSEF